MKITEVRVTKLEGTTKLKAFASITFDNCFVISSLKVMDGNNGLFVAMPSQKKGDNYTDVCYPINKEFREELQKAVLQKYNEGTQEFKPVEGEDDLPF